MYPSQTTHSVSHPMLPSAEPSPQLVRRKSGRNACWVLSPLLTPTTTPSRALGTARVGADVGHWLSLRQLEQRALSRGQVGDISGARELEGNVFGGLQFTEFHQAIASLHQGVGNEQGSLGVSLRWDDGCLLLLLCLEGGRKGCFSLTLLFLRKDYINLLQFKIKYLLYDKPSPLSLLLSHLFHFNSLCELFAKSQMCLKEDNAISALKFNMHRK